MVPLAHRDTELAESTRWWDDPAAGAALLWGRRRVGETALLQRFSESTAPERTIFHTGAGRARPARGRGGGRRAVVAR